MAHSRAPIEVGPAAADAGAVLPPWHALETADVLARVGSSPQGLSATEAARRLSEVGPNVLEHKSRESLFKILFRQINDPLIWVLIASSIVALVLRQFEDGLVVAALVVANTIIGFVQELRAGKAIDALREMVPELATVLRDGKAAQLPVAGLVPGDIVMLASGERVPADLRLLEAKGLRCEEAALTGESTPADKSVRPVEEQAGLGDRASMALGGTLVVAGRGTTVVVATGTWPSCWTAPSTSRPRSRWPWGRSGRSSPSASWLWPP